MSTHRGLKLSLLGLGICVLSSVMAGPAHAQQGLGQRLGEQLDEGINRLSGELREGWASLRQTVDRMGVQGRVYSRLRWDKDIADASLDIESHEGGVVVLRGKVPTAEAKRKATELAQDTIGVNRVVDELNVQSPSESAPSDRGSADRGSAETP